MVHTDKLYIHISNLQETFLFEIRRIKAEFIYNKSFKLQIDEIILIPFSNRKINYGYF